MKRVLFMVFIMACGVFAKAQDSSAYFMADYAGGQAVYCGAQGNGFYEGSGGYIGNATYNVADKELQFTYDASQNSGAGWFDFVLKKGNGPTASCMSMVRSGKDGVDMSEKKKVQIKIKASVPAEVNFYLGSGIPSSWVPPTSTYNLGNDSSVVEKLQLTTSYQIITLDYSKYAAFEKWEGKNRVNCFGFEFKKRTDAIISIAYVKIN